MSLQIRDTCLSMIIVNEKHYLSDLTSWCQYLASCVLFTTKKAVIQQKFQTQRKNIRQFW